MATSDDAISRRVEQKVARNNERIATRYNQSASSRRNISIRVNYLQSKALRHG